MQGVWLLAILLGFSISLAAGDNRKRNENEALWRQQEIVAARCEGLDTLPEYVAAVDSCRRAWLRMIVADSSCLDRVARERYQQLAQLGEGWRCRVSEIYHYLPQTATARVVKQAEEQMDSIYQALQHGADFEELVLRYSDFSDARWVERLQMPLEWEEAVFSLPAGSWTKPFFTPQGLHIVRVLEHAPLPAYEAMRLELWAALGPQSWQQATQASIERLKQQYNYQPDKVGIDELLRQGQTSRRLFTLDGQVYTGADFALFAKGHFTRLRRQWNDFVLRTLLACEESHIGQNHPELNDRLSAWSDSLLWQVAARRHWGDRALSDTVRLATFFNTHRSQFHWPEPRYQGMVLRCTNKRVAKRARKLLKALPETEWQEAVRLMLNGGGLTQVQAEQGLFARGDHPWIDHLLFKEEAPAPDAAYPVTICVGRKQKGPEQWKEVGPELRIAYQQYLRKEWREAACEACKVEINEEDLKTVNSQGGN